MIDKLKLPEITDDKIHYATIARAKVLIYFKSDKMTAEEVKFVKEVLGSDDEKR